MRHVDRRTVRGRVGMHHVDPPQQAAAACSGREGGKQHRNAGERQRPTCSWSSKSALATSSSSSVGSWSARSFTILVRAVNMAGRRGCGGGRQGGRRVRTGRLQAGGGGARSSLSAGVVRARVARMQRARAARVGRRYTREVWPRSVGVQTARAPAVGTSTRWRGAV